MAMTTSTDEQDTAAPAPPPEFELVQKAVEGLVESVSWEPPDTARVEVRAGKLRTKRIDVVFGQKNRQGEPVVCIRAECGPAKPTVKSVMFRYNVTLRYGKYDVEKGENGEEIAVLRHYAARARLTPMHLREIVESIFNDSEQLRCELALDERTYPWQATDPSTKQPWR